MKQTGTRKFGVLFLLLLVFFQQVGAGLYVHNLVHNGKARHEQHSDKGREISFTCSCVDNFLAPCVGTENPELAPSPAVYSSFTAFYIANPGFTTPVYSSLRGPPVFIG